MTTKKRKPTKPAKRSARKVRSKKLAAASEQRLVDMCLTVVDGCRRALERNSEVLRQCAEALQRSPLYTVGPTLEDTRAGSINGGSEPPPDVSDSELSDVKRSIAAPVDRPLVIPGQQ